MSPAQPPHDVFISHSSADADLAARIRGSLGQAGVSVWLDQDNLRAGALLARALQDAITASRNLVVLWSEPASVSEWVTTEWTSVVNLNHQPGVAVKGILPCLTDETPLALFLLNYIYCDFRQSYDDGIGALIEALGKEPPPPPAAEKPDPPDHVQRIFLAQQQVLGALQAGQVAAANEAQARIDGVVSQALEAEPDDPYVLSLAGYHKKNAYIIGHWHELLQGQRPPDPVLTEAARLFFQALAQKPEDPSALNGLGSVFIYRDDLDAAEFYVRRALERSREENLPYAAAEHDLALIERLKAARG